MENNLKYLRRSKEFDMTQQELADRLGISKMTVSTIERGGNLSGKLMLKISAVFDMDPREIFFTDDVS